MAILIAYIILTIIYLFVCHKFELGYYEHEKLVGVIGTYVLFVFFIIPHLLNAIWVDNWDSDNNKIKYK